MDDNIKKNSSPLYGFIGEIIAIWTLANIGYYFLLPKFGFVLSYNASPVAIAVYFFVWVCITVFNFKETYTNFHKHKFHIWKLVLLSLYVVALSYLFVYLYSLLPTYSSPPLFFQYSDIFLASPWYFLPKAVEILVQQLLISALIIELYLRLHTLRKVVWAYAICFVLAHIALFALDRASLPYSFIMTLGALITSLIFPYLILRVRNGFVYAYLIHFVFYIIIATLLHVLPLPGYAI